MTLNKGISLILTLSFPKEKQYSALTLIIIINLRQRFSFRTVFTSCDFFYPLFAGVMLSSLFSLLPFFHPHHCVHMLPRCQCAIASLLHPSVLFEHTSTRSSAITICGRSVPSTNILWNYLEYVLPPCESYCYSLNFRSMQIKFKAVRNISIHL